MGVGKAEVKAGCGLQVAVGVILSKTKQDPGEEGAGPGGAGLLGGGRSLRGRVSRKVRERGLGEGTGKKAS